MEHNDSIIFLADKVLQNVKRRIEFNLDDQLTAIRIEFNEDNQKIFSHKTDFSNEEIELFNAIQEIPNYEIRNFLIEEDYIKKTKAINFYKLTKLGREIKSAGSISNYKRREDAITRQKELANDRDQLNQKLLVYGAIGAAVGAIALVAWEVFVFFWKHCHK